MGTVHVQEKVDGANAQIWLENGEIKMGSRTRVLGNEEFNGFVPYVKAHKGIQQFFTTHPESRLYGEWLVRHTIAYKETAYRKFYLFDIFGWNGVDEFIPAAAVKEIGELYGIDTVPLHGVFENPTIEQLQEFVGKSDFGDRGEGIVIKNLGFTNGFGEKVFAKIVTQAFKEDSAIAFGGNNKYSETYHEMYVVNKYMTLPRIKKIMDKTQPEVNKKLDMEHIPRVCNTAYHDMLTEEIWAIQKEVPKLDFKALSRLAFSKAKQIYVDILNDDVSVHDQSIAALHRSQHS